jgi:acetyl-CoA carboxylase biotin carboxyl carrier protein
LELEKKGVRIRVRRDLPPNFTSTAVEVPQPIDTVSPLLASPASSPPPAAESSHFLTVTSPIVGTFYRASSPDADPYVEEGMVVKKGQVLCIVEAMKLMNEIEAEADGKIVKVLVESTTPVEFGQPLFLIDPQ